MRPDYDEQKPCLCKVEPSSPSRILLLCLIYAQQILTETIITTGSSNYSKMLCRYTTICILHNIIIYFNKLIKQFFSKSNRIH